MERHLEQQEADSQNGIPGRSNLVAVEPAHIIRLKGVMTALGSFIKENQDGTPISRLAGVMSTFGVEMAEELRDMDEMRTRIFMAQTGEIIAWIGHGDNSRLPDAVRAFAEQIQPSPPTVENEPIGTSAKLDTATR